MICGDEGMRESYFNKIRISTLGSVCICHIARKPIQLMEVSPGVENAVVSPVCYFSFGSYMTDTKDYGKCSS